MRTSIILALLSILGPAGCIGTLGELKKGGEAPIVPKSAFSGAAVDVIGGPGGYQVRGITVDKPSPLCSYQSASVLAEADAAFMAAVRDGYIESWNKSIDARTPLLPKTAEQKTRYNYYKSKEIKAGKDVEQNRHRYLRTAQQTQAQTNRHGDAEQRERYLRAACIEKAYSAGRLRGSNKAEEDVRAVIDRAPGG